MDRDLRQRARARLVVRGVFATLLAACAAGCTETTSSNASLSTGASRAASGPTIAFDSIDGPPVGVFNRLVDNISSEAQGRALAIASREGVANYRVRGYLAAQVIKGRAHISWVWDVYDDDKFRTLRITGEEAGGRAGSDAWAVADEAMLRRIARLAVDKIAGHVANPSVPVADPPSAMAEAPGVPARPQRKRRAAEAPTAAEKLALAAAR